MEMVTFNKFTLGKWNVYRCDDYEDSFDQDLTPLLFSRKLKTFLKEKLKLDVWTHYFGSEELLCFQVYIKKVFKLSTNNASTGDEHGGRKETFKRFKLAVSLDDNVLFCSLKLTVKLHDALSNVLECSGLREYEFHQSDPTSVLKFIRQSENLHKLLKEQEEYLKHERIRNGEIEEDTTLPNHLSMKCPTLKYIKLETDDIPVTTISGEEIILSNVGVEIKSPSLYELSSQFAEFGYVNKTPWWLDLSRKEGKNVLKTKYPNK